MPALTRLEVTSALSSVSVPVMVMPLAMLTALLRGLLVSLRVALAAVRVLAVTLVSMKLASPPMTRSVVAVAPASVELVMRRSFETARSPVMER